MVLAILGGGDVGTAHEPLTLAAPGRAVPILYAAVEAPGAARAMETWRTFFGNWGLEMRCRNAGSKTDLAGQGAVLAFETEATCAVANRIGLDLSKLKGARDEAHLIAARIWEGRPLVLVVGKTASGADAGANYLLSKVGCVMDAEDTLRAVTCPPFEIFRQPFFRNREATLCPTGREFPRQPAWVNFENWERTRLERYPAYLKACGFNSVQLMELVTYHAATREWSGGYRGGIPKGATIDTIQQALYTLADAAHAQGMSVSQYIWGSPADGCKWADPKTRPAREAFYSELARRYGPKMDHVITHWVDEGHEGGFETPLDATMFIGREYQKHNPKVKVTCDAWFNPGLYQGIGDEKHASKDVGIAIERWYDAAQAEQVMKAGRKVGIWGWYLSDFEMTYGSHLYTKTLDQYFSALPENAGEQVDWISSELCFHALPSRINLYVVGRKMWEPRAALADLTLDYCRSMYGPANADILRMVYETVEEGQTEVRYGMVQQDRYPVARGTAEFREKAQKALKALRGVRLPPQWKPNFTGVASPQQDIDHLLKALEECVASRGK